MTTPKSSRIERKEFERKAKKAAASIDRTMMSETSAETLSKDVPAYFAQYRQERSDARKSDTRGMGIRGAVTDRLLHDPTMSAKDCWNSFSDENQGIWETDEWEVHLEGDRLWQSDKENKRDSNISFTTFRTHYFRRKR